MSSSSAFNRRAFLGSAALGVAGLAMPSFAQQIDPYTGLPRYDGGGAAPGQAPDMGAYQIDPNADSRRNQSSFRSRHWSEFYPSLGKGVILADITSRAVYYWSADESTQLVFPCSIPITEELTRRGATEVVRKTENPTWTPTPSMREKDPSLPLQVAGGAPENPLGLYALYLSWPAYLIHGTHDTRKIGRKSSSGCYGLYNEHITRLYAVAEVGTQVTVF